jgi:Domain of unknown function (DUF4440)
MKYSISLAVALVALAGVLSCSGQASPSASPRDALIGLENEWLAGAHDGAVLDRILASDFVHPLGNGMFATKDQHIDFVAKNLPPPERRQHFEEMKVRVYGDVGIVTGMVVSEEPGKEAEKTIFTDVFAFREGRWQAINAQENKVK